MTTTVKNLQATSGAFSSFETSQLVRRDLKEDDVEIDILYCGICHSDIDAVEHGFAPYPITPGHEITGRVSRVGSKVTKFQVGDPVGAGCFINSCGQCRYCQQGEEQFCQQGVVVVFAAQDYDGSQTQGGYSEKIVVREDFVLRIPEKLDLAEASPLLCAGITTYNPLKRYQVGPGSKVAIVGLGGLGHIAVQFAHAMGAEVTVLGHSASKKNEAQQFGADSYEILKNPEDFGRLAGQFDFILNTTAVNLNLDTYLSLLTVNGVLCYVGIPHEAQSFQVFSLFGNQATITASNVGGLALTQEMLDFAAAHDVKPAIEMIEATPAELGQAYQNILDSKVRYRYVIDMKTL